MKAGCGQLWQQQHGPVAQQALNLGAGVQTHQWCLTVLSITRDLWCCSQSFAKLNRSMVAI
jgi:hypothetical protein